MESNSARNVTNGFQLALYKVLYEQPVFGFGSLFRYAVYLSIAPIVSVPRC